jgi:uncharacterized phage-associated protein
MLTCYDVANYFLAQMSEESGDLISNLKLQKLLYYAQGFHLALFDRPLFLEPLEAWTHGPVVPELFDYYHQQYGWNAIPCPQEIDFSKFDRSTRDFLNEVYAEFGQFAAWKLRSMTMAEYPYQVAAQQGVPISYTSLKNYFLNQLVDEKETEEFAQSA